MLNCLSPHLVAWGNSAVVLPNDRRISCKRQASRPHNHYVPFPSSAPAARAELHSDALVGCMRGLGAAPSRVPQ